MEICVQSGMKKVQAHVRGGGRVAGSDNVNPMESILFPKQTDHIVEIEFLILVNDERLGYTFVVVSKCTSDKHHARTVTRRWDIF